MFDYKEKLPLFIANGAPSEDTLKHYNEEIDNFLNWCKGNSFEPLADVSEEDAAEYLQYLVQREYSPASIALKIAAAKTFYFVAKRVKVTDANPFENIKPKKPAYDDADFDFLDVEELREICRAVSARTDKTAKRDLAIIMFMAVEGLRAVEIHRMNDTDYNDKNKSFLIHGKGRDSYIYPCQDTLDIYNKYMQDRPEPVTDEQGTPTFIGFSKKFFGERISRNGIRWAINHVLQTAGKKKKGAACHMLRHSCGTNLYQETKDLRLVQETLRQKSPEVAARYAHVSRRINDRQTAAISPLGSGDSEK